MSGTLCKRNLGLRVLKRRPLATLLMPCYCLKFLVALNKSVLVLGWNNNVFPIATLAMKQLHHHVTPVSRCAGINSSSTHAIQNKNHNRELNPDSGWLIYRQPRRQDSFTRYSHENLFHPNFTELCIKTNGGP